MKHTRTLLLLLVIVGWTLAAEKSTVDLETSRGGNETNKPAYVPKRNGFEVALSSVGTFLDDFFGREKNLRDDSNGIEGRTFGQKRIQFMLMPMIYKMGIMMTMLAVLTVISLKGLTIGVILLVLKLGTIFAKLYSWKAQGHDWSASPSQPVHVHVHNQPFSHAHHQAYSAWSPADAPVEDEYYYKG